MKIQLIAVVQGIPCNDSNHMHAEEYANLDKCLTVTPFEDWSGVELSTEKGTYTLEMQRHNVFRGLCNGHMVSAQIEGKICTLSF